MSEHAAQFAQFVAMMPKRLDDEQLIQRFEHYLVTRTQYGDEQIAELSAAFAKWLKSRNEGEGEKQVKQQPKPKPKPPEKRRPESPEM